MHVCTHVHTHHYVHRLHAQTHAHRYTQAVTTLCLPFCLLFYFLLNIIWWAFYDGHVNTQLESVLINVDSFKLNFKQISLESIFYSLLAFVIRSPDILCIQPLWPPHCPPGLVSFLELGVGDWGHWTPQLPQETSGWSACISWPCLIWALLCGLKAFLTHVGVSRVLEPCVAEQAFFESINLWTG